MAASAEKTDPKLWDRIKSEVTASDKGGKAGQWSARKAQAATKAYKEAGGGYKGKKSDENSLTQWSNEEWDTKSGKPSGKTGERYLPKKARSSLSKDEYDRSTRKKRADTKDGKQFSNQPKDVAEKSAAARKAGTKQGRASGGPTKADLMRKAKSANIRGRSTMSKDELEKALHAA
ncbi:hypothetical protein [Methylobacterium bullatum]|uniref:DUF5872 domain-containing protein n=1 Tax=Methylobacterium bullatum TaxID=570505 RepID=A0A679KDF3_9HYPH|nr:hypothetical protein [Methylobacterium bullatum]MBD8902489.1 hypothetical protein [Methylobacterium bullatum]GJD40624.1 hypothetical protein OICFNHDK_3096 [Methylobacterium bullatum]CAA2145352.1 hypothetical protein MBLL_04472 [Methylobacterium bullatum]